MARKERKRTTPKKPLTPRHPKPWDPPPPAAAGDEEKATLFAAVGSALSAWEALDGRLAHIFGDLVAPGQDPLPAKRAFGSVLTFRGRADLVDAASEAAFFLRPDSGSDLKKALADLVQEARNFSPRRNEIAHGMVTSYYRRALLFGLVPAARKSRSGYVLGPSEYATNKRALEPGRVIMEPVYEAPAYAYSSAQIAVIEGHFVQLEKRARELSMRLWRHMTRRKA